MVSYPRPPRPNLTPLKTLFFLVIFGSLVENPSESSDFVCALRVGLLGEWLLDARGICALPAVPIDDVPQSDARSRTQALSGVGFR